MSASPSPSIRRSIIVADDDPFIRDLLDAVLEDAGFRIRHAHNGAAALRLARELVPDVILLDVMMPEMDGHAVCRELRDDPAFARTKIIMLTARDTADDRSASASAGADLFLTKPFSPLELIEAVNAVRRGVA